MSNCKTCKWWDKGGATGSPITRFKELENGELEQMKAHFCVFMPKTVWKYEDDYCGQFDGGKNEK